MIKFIVFVVLVIGEFEVCEGGVMVVSGEVFVFYKFFYILDDESKCILFFRKLVKIIGLDFMVDEVYREFRLRGYEYGFKFCGIF